MSIPSFERMFRVAADLDVDKSDLRRYEDFVNRTIADVLTVAQENASANGRDVIEPIDLRLGRGLRDRISRRHEARNAMSEQQGLFERYIRELWNDGDLDVADDIYTDDHVYQDPHLPGLPPGRRACVSGSATQAGDPRPGRGGRGRSVEDAKTTCRWVYEAVHRGELGIFRPTGRTLVIAGVHVCHHRGCRIVQSWVMDRLGTFEQIDAVIV